MIKKEKKIGYCIYLNEKDIKELNLICKKRKESKSAIIRKFIHSSKYINSLYQIEANNKLNAEFLYQLNKLGTNINQIAYHLNIDITNHDKAKDDLTQIFLDFKEIINNYKQKIENRQINLNVNRYQTIRDENE
ncbi:plasmid mobilization relaxosome protein MobC [Campylobacter lanienae]|uniref:plasmid mobilization relaxosome protein MobC n=1 Tax=Campylobacter lanienae TaxID=75658 RepID=UPI0015D9180E|nr:plasmid mobilization relaxosome protein MobC [Campylobacter lanienae]